MESIILSNCALIAVRIYHHVTFQYFANSNWILYNSSFSFFYNIRIWFLGFFYICFLLFCGSCFVCYFHWFWFWSILASVVWFHIFVPVTTAWRVLRLWIEERPPIWRVAANKLNKQSWTADKGWSFSLGVGRGANNPSL